MYDVIVIATTYLIP